MDIFIYLIKDFNPFFLDGTFNKDSDLEMVKMLWEYSMPKSLYDYIKLPENFEKLCDGKNSYKDANLIIKKYVYNKAFCNEFFEFFKKLLVVYQYIYSMLISKYYAQNDKFGIQNKVPFTLNYKHWKKNKVAEDNFKQLAKNPVNFDRNIEVFEQLSITLPDFEQPPTMALPYSQSEVSLQLVSVENQKYQLPKQNKKTDQSC